MASVKMYKKTGDAKAVAIQENLEKNFGFLPEVFQVMGRNGEFLEHVLGVANAAGKGLDPKTNEPVKEFNSIKYAGKYLNIDDPSHISKVCKGKRITAYGYKWEYV